MKVRLNYGKVAAGVYEAMEALDEYLGACGLDRSLLHLVRLRASQVNGCAYCLDMHWKDLRALGEAEQRLYSLDAWRECPYYTERERAALACDTKPCGLAIRQSSEKVAIPGQGVIIWLRTSDAAALCKTLKERGVPIVKDLQQSPFGMTFSFQDPDGHVLAVHDGG